jgi:hypothetical protein
MQIAFNKPTIKIHKSKENLHIMNAFRLKPICNRFNLYKVYMDTIFAYNKA